jgi:hypothetical protein
MPKATMRGEVLLEKWKEASSLLGATTETNITAKKDICRLLGCAVSSRGHPTGTGTVVDDLLDTRRPTSCVGLRLEEEKTFPVTQVKGPVKYDVPTSQCGPPNNFNHGRARKYPSILSPVYVA